MPGDLFHLVTGISPNTNTFTVASPGVTTTSTTQVSTGQGIGLTPKRSGIVAVWASGYATIGTNGDQGQFTMYWGTGSIPANNGSLSGFTEFGNLSAGTSAAANQPFPFSFVGMVSGLTLGTIYNFVLAYASLQGGTLTLSSDSIVVIEM